MCEHTFVCCQVKIACWICCAVCGGCKDVGREKVASCRIEHYSAVMLGLFE